MEIKVKYFTDMEPIGYTGGSLHSNWIDMRVAEDVEMRAGEYRLLPLGVAIQLPEGYEALVAPRSSTFGKYGILMANSVGIIDESYCGDTDQWRFPALAVRDTRIEKGTRIAQFRLLKHQEDVELITVEKLEGADRGGIGSTGET